MRNLINYHLAIEYQSAPKTESLEKCSRVDRSRGRAACGRRFTSHVQRFASPVFAKEAFFFETINRFHKTTQANKQKHKTLTYVSQLSISTTQHDYNKNILFY